MIKKAITRLLGRQLVTSIRLKLFNRHDERDFLSGLLIDENPRDSLMLDVGAHFGESLIPFKDYGWRVFAFEPDPDPRKKESLLKYESDSFFRLSGRPLVTRKENCQFMRVMSRLVLLHS